MANITLKGRLDTSRSERGIGFVDYVEDGRSIAFWCRRGAGAVLAYIYCPHAIEWQQQHAWALDQKAEITALVVEHFRQRFPASIPGHDTEAIIALRSTHESTPNAA
jgi:hypothetical protein